MNDPLFVGYVPVRNVHLIKPSKTFDNLESAIYDAKSHGLTYHNISLIYNTEEPIGYLPAIQLDEYPLNLEHGRATALLIEKFVHNLELVWDGRVIYELYLNTTNNNDQRGFKYKT